MSGPALSGPDWFDADGPESAAEPGPGVAAPGDPWPAEAGAAGGSGFGSGSGRGADRAREGRQGGGAGAGSGRRRASGWSAQRSAGRGEERAPESLEEQVSRARRLVVDALSRTERTRGQLAQMLVRKGIEAEAAEEILDRFTELGLIDDAQYARAFVESRHINRGLGSQALAFQLRQRGVDGELVSAALEQLDDEQQFETACRLVESRLSRMSRLDEQAQQRRLAGFLARKGYSGDVALRAVRLAMENNRTAQDED
ncbi:MAG TPA: regulatory protein RecX [Actinocrinis sp.]|nr:regulatory protein RecX [Actinocrinis sp.]